MTIENQIKAHYANKDASEVAQGNDHLHIGGSKATEYFLEKLKLTPAMKVLDIGCGVGGPSLMAAKTYGCHITGIDLTPEFIELAQQRAQEASLSERTNFAQARTDGLDFGDESFDLVMMLHVGMNVPDKQALYKECARVLKPKGTLALYDILAEANIGKITYPLPWAPTVETSFLEDFETIGHKLKNAGFIIKEHENRKEFAVDSITRLFEKQGDTLSDFRKIVVHNLLESVKQNACAPHIILTQKT